MRRLLAAFLTSLGICVVASAFFAVVAHLDSTSRFIYPLGTLIVAPIPVMLALLFAIMRRGLRDEAAGMSIPGGRIEPEVSAAAARAFPADERAEALAILATYGAGPEEPQRARVHHAILRLSDGDLDLLRYFTDQAKQGYQDVLAWEAESPMSGQR